MVIICGAHCIQNISHVWQCASAYRNYCLFSSLFLNVKFIFRWFYFGHFQYIYLNTHDHWLNMKAIYKSTWNLIYFKQKHWLTDEWPKEIHKHSECALCEMPASFFSCLQYNIWTNEYNDTIWIFWIIWLKEKKTRSYHKNRSREIRRKKQ